MVSRTAPVAVEGLTAEEWRGLLTSHPNALLVGPSDATTRVVEALVPHLRAPLYRAQANWLSLPKGECGTLIVDEVARLSDEDQHRLLSWLLDGNRETPAQIIATSSSPVFPRVSDGSFLDMLYYRLNVMSFTLGR